jgi:hypothetical protein
MCPDAIDHHHNECPIIHIHPVAAADELVHGVPREPAVGVAVRGAVKPMAKKQRPSKIAARKAPRKAPRQVVEVPVEDTIIDMIEEPVPGVVVVTEYETIRTATPISSGSEPRHDAGPETEEQ